jgi:hypothetical protein
MWAAVQWLAITFLVPETYHPAVLRNVAKKMRKETGDDRWYAPIEKMDKGVFEVSLSLKDVFREIC